MVTTGETIIEEPVPAAVPPQLTVYHCHEAPVPSNPPTTDNVVELPGQIGFTDGLIFVGAVESVLVTFTVTETQAVELQVPSPLTK